MSSVGVSASRFMKMGFAVSLHAAESATANTSAARHRG
jgi:hypothetical protein